MLKIHFRSGFNIVFFIFLIFFQLSFKIFSQSSQIKSTTKLDTVVLQLPFFHQFQFAGYYAAQLKGFYAEEGLYVKILEPKVDQYTIYQVVKGNANFGVMGSSLITSRLSGEPVVLLKAIFQHSPFSIITLKKSGIRSPSDLVGKKVMIGSARGGAKILGMLRNEGINEKELIFVQHSWNYDDLISGKVDAATGYCTVQPYIIEQKGFQTNCINPIDYGVDFYGDMLFTSESQIKNNSKRVDKFIAASVKGWKYAFSNIEETVELILSLPTEREFVPSKEMLLNEAKLSKPFVLPDIVEVGHINPYRLENIVNAYKKLEYFEEDVSLGNFIYNPENNYSFFSSKTIFWIVVVLGSLLLVFAVSVFQMKKTVKTKTEDLNKFSQKHEAMLNAIPDIMFRLSKDGNYLDYHPPREGNLAIPKEDIIGKNINELLPPNVVKLVNETISKVLNEKEIQTIEYEMPHLDEVKRFEARIVNSGKDEILAMVRDITKESESLEALKKSEDKFYKVFHSNPEAILVSDIKNAEIVAANQSFADLIGYSLDEIIGKSTYELKIWDSEKRRKEVIEKLKTEGIVKNFEINFKTKMGEVRSGIISSEISEFSGLSSVISIIQDVTERNKAEELLRNSEEKLKKTLEELEKYKNKLQNENIYLQEEIKFEKDFHRIITKNENYKDVLRQIEKVAPTDATVLILGETGTGKELLARSIHDISDRSSSPLVKVNCAALPENLIESELFGHVKGAFTGAVKDKVGRFELADNGTIFLDEIGELPLELQSKLLRVLQENEFEKLGCTTTITINVRVIAATNRDLKKLVEEGTFREDLFFRLNVFPIETIPLRERKEDIPLLVNYFLKELNLKMGKSVNQISHSTMEDLQNYQWPGNVRELENVIERAVILSHDNKLKVGELIKTWSEVDTISPQSKTLIEVEKEQILIALKKSNWKIEGINGAAKILGTPPSTLRDKIKKYNIEKV